MAKKKTDQAPSEPTVEEQAGLVEAKAQTEAQLERDPIEAAHQRRQAAENRNPEVYAAIAAEAEARGGLSGAEYDEAMARHANGVAEATQRKAKAAPDPNRPRTQYMVVGYLDDGKPGEVLCLHKSSRSAHKYLALTGALVRRVYKTVSIFRVRKLAD